MNIICELWFFSSFRTGEKVRRFFRVGNIICILSLSNFFIDRKRTCMLQWWRRWTFASRVSKPQIPALPLLFQEVHNWRHCPTYWFWQEMCLSSDDKSEFFFMLSLIGELSYFWIVRITFNRVFLDVPAIKLWFGVFSISNWVWCLWKIHLRNLCH
jgi:hypothetical protein